MTQFPASVEAARLAGGTYRAGNTDLGSRRRLGLSSGPLVDIGDIEELRGVRWVDGVAHIGATTRISDLAADSDLAARYPGITATAGSLATPQVRAMATVAGSLLQKTRCPYVRHGGFSCFKTGASSCPARLQEFEQGVVFDRGPCIAPHPSSMAMAFLGYGATVDLADGTTWAMVDLLGDGSDGTRDHQLPGGALVRSVTMGEPATNERAAYGRATGRALAEWPIVEGMVRLVVADGAIEGVSVVAGGIAPVPLILRQVSSDLQGVHVDDIETISRICATVSEHESDFPATAYKLTLLEGLLRRLVSDALAGRSTTELAVGERGLV